MKRSSWRTGPPLKHTQPVIRPTAGQLLRQIGVLLAIAALWAGALLVLLGATSASNVAFVAEQGTPERKATSTSVASSTPSATASSTPSRTPATPTPIAGATATRAAAATATASATATATPAATDTPTPEAATPTPETDPLTPEAVAATFTPAGPVAASISFARDVQPIFNQICVKCHGGEEVKEGLILKTYAEVMQGSDNGAVIVPGDPANSLLVDMITKGKMPKNGPKLLPRQIQVIVNWVTAGAPNN